MTSVASPPPASSPGSRGTPALRLSCPRFSGCELAPLLSPPYDVVDEDERRELEASDPHNIVRLILPRDVEGEPRSAYRAAASQLAAWRSNGVLVPDDTPALYVYEMEEGGSRTRGLVGAVACPARGRRRAGPRTRWPGRPTGWHYRGDAGQSGADLPGLFGRRRGGAGGVRVRRSHRSSCCLRTASRTESGRSRTRTLAAIRGPSAAAGGDRRRPPPVRDVPPPPGRPARGRRRGGAVGGAGAAGRRQHVRSPGHAIHRYVPRPAAGLRGLRVARSRSGTSRRPRSPSWRPPARIRRSSDRRLRRWLPLTDPAERPVDDTLPA